jgi:hypothetical protein
MPIAEIYGSILSTRTAKKIADAQNSTNIQLAELGIEGDRIMADAQKYGWDTQKIIAEIQAASAEKVAAEKRRETQIITAGNLVTAIQQGKAGQYISQAGIEKVIWIGAMVVLVIIVSVGFYVKVIRK